MVYFKKYYRVWLPVLSIFLFIIVVELICRGFNLTEKVDADFKFYIHNVDNDLEQDFMEEDPLLMWRPKPNYPGLNSEGFREDKEYTIKKDKNTFRILCLGDSSTFGLGISNSSDLYHSLLEDKLNKEFKSQDIRYEVINGGITGYTSYQGLNLYRFVGAKYHPDIVTFYFGVNDPIKRFYLSDKDILQIHILPSKINTVTYRFLSRLSSYRLLRKGIWKVLNKNNTNKVNVSRVSKEEFKTNILELNNLCKNDGTLLILISPPLSKEKAIGWERTEDIIEYRKLLEDTAKGYNIPLIDIKELTEQSESPTINFIDAVHPNEAGHIIIMNKLYSYLISNDILPENP